MFSLTFIRWLLQFSKWKYLWGERINEQLLAKSTLICSLGADLNQNNFETVAYPRSSVSVCPSDQWRVQGSPYRNPFNNMVETACVSVSREFASQKATFLIVTS